MMEVNTSGRPDNMMPFMDAVKSCLTKSFDFRGRASRSEYWWFVLFGMVFNISCTILAFVSDIGVIALLPVLLVPASVCLVIRRLHDTGKSGWMQLLFIIPLVNFVLIILWLVVDEGEPQGNAYGDVPTNMLE